uniref:PITH domain-containing protein n=1 Tax=Globodera pallida TaxID=36090 RepID=A0A183CGJ9_GLOPA
MGTCASNKRQMVVRLPSTIKKLGTTAIHATAFKNNVAMIHTQQMNSNNTVKQYNPLQHERENSVKLLKHDSGLNLLPAELQLNMTALSDETIFEREKRMVVLLVSSQHDKPSQLDVDFQNDTLTGGGAGNDGKLCHFRAYPQIKKLQNYKKFCGSDSSDKTIFEREKRMVVLLVSSQHDMPSQLDVDFQNDDTLTGEEAGNDGKLCHFGAYPQIKELQYYKKFCGSDSSDKLGYQFTSSSPNSATTLLVAAKSVSSMLLNKIEKEKKFVCIRRKMQQQFSRRSSTKRASVVDDAQSLASGSIAGGDITTTAAAVPFSSPTPSEQHQQNGIPISSSNTKAVDGHHHHVHHRHQEDTFSVHSSATNDFDSHQQQQLLQQQSSSSF